MKNKLAKLVAAVVCLFLVSISALAQVKIRNLPDDSSPIDRDYIPVDKVSPGPLVTVKSTRGSIRSGLLPLTGGTLTGDLIFSGNTKFTMANGIYTPACCGITPVIASTTGSTLVGATNEGLRTSMFSFFDTRTSATDGAIMTMDVIQTSHSSTIIRTGLHVKVYTEPDNGGDTSGILVAQTGGGSGLSVYKLHNLRPTGFTNYSSSIQGAAEFGTGDQSFAGLFISGSQLGGANTDRSHSIQARIDNSVSDGIIINPQNGTFDSRYGLVVATPQINSAPINIKAALLLNGKMSLGAMSTPDSRFTVNDNASSTPPAPFSGSSVHIVGTDSTSLRLTVDSFAANNSIDFRRANGTAASPSALLANDVINQEGISGYGATGYAAGARVAIRSTAGENWTDTAQGAYLSIFTTPLLSATAAEVFRLDTNGNLLLGPSLAAGTSAKGVIGLSNQTAPTSSPANMVQLFSQTLSGSDANLFVRNEAGTGGNERISGLRKRVSTQFDATSTTTLANVTGLTFNVEAGKPYGFSATIFTTSNVAGGVKLAIGGTATATSIIYKGESDNGGTITDTRVTSLGSVVCAVTAATVEDCEIKGTILVNAAGTITVQFAQNVSNGTASSVLVGSRFYLEPLSN